MPPLAFWKAWRDIEGYEINIKDSTFLLVHKRRRVQHAQECVVCRVLPT